jgi:hypothetical protein
MKKSSKKPLHLRREVVRVLGALELGATGGGTGTATCASPSNCACSNTCDADCGRPLVTAACRSAGCTGLLQ